MTQQRLWWTRHGSATAWEDLRFPAANLRINPATSRPLAEEETGCYLFANDQDERVTMQVQLPHAYKEGSTIYPHVHWAKTTDQAGSVLWRLEYRYCPIGGILAGSWTAIESNEVTASTPDDDTAYRHLITRLPPIEIPDGKISDMFVMRLWRISSDPSDDYPANAMLAEFDIHYEIDYIGSRQEFIK